MMNEELPTDDVTDIAENDLRLKELYKKKTGNDGEVEDVVPNPVAVRGPFSYTTAIIVWLKSDVGGTVKLFLGDRNVRTWQTLPETEEAAVMVFLGPGYYSWWMGGAKVKYIK